MFKEAKEGGKGSGMVLSEGLEELDFFCSAAHVRVFRKQTGVGGGHWSHGLAVCAISPAGAVLSQEWQGGLNLV